MHHLSVATTTASAYLRLYYLLNIVTMVRIDALTFLINLPLHVMAPLINEEAMSGNIGYRDWPISYDILCCSAQNFNLFAQCYAHFSSFR